MGKNLFEEREEDLTVEDLIKKEDTKIKKVPDILVKSKDKAVAFITDEKTKEKAKIISNTTLEVSSNIFSKILDEISATFSKLKLIYYFKPKMKYLKMKNEAFKRGLTYEQYERLLAKEKLKDELPIRILKAILRITWKPLLFFTIMITIPGSFVVMVPVLTLGVIIYPFYAYKRNLKIFNLEWVIKYQNDLERRREKKIANNIKYDVIPIKIYDASIRLSKFLNDKYSGDGIAKIEDSEYFYSEHYGGLVKSLLDEEYFRHPVKDLEDYEAQNHFIIPQRSYAEGKKVYWQVDKYIIQSADALSGLITKDEYIKLIKTDNNVNWAFKEVAEELKIEREQKELEEQIKREQEELEGMYDIFREKGLNDKAIKIIMKLKKNQDDWGISVHNMFGRSMEYTKNYIKVRVDLMGDTTRKNLESNTDKIAQKIGILPRVERAENESSAYLTFVLNNAIRGKKLSAKQLREDAEKGELNLGQTIFGDYIIEYKQKDEEDNLEIAGLQGSGKSYTTMFNLYSRMYLKAKEFNEYMYDEITIASTKPADYLKLGWDKIGITILDEPIATFKYLINLHKEGMRRKNLFTEERVGSFYEYNKLHKNTDRKYLARKLFVFDEVQNMLSQAKKIQINLGGKKVKLSDAIVDLHIMIVKEDRKSVV